MSHPLGPWSESHIGQGLVKTSGAVTRFNNGTVSATFPGGLTAPVGTNVTRSGYNSGRQRAYTIPRSSALTKSVIDDTPAYAYIRFPVNDTANRTDTELAQCYANRSYGLTGWTRPTLGHNLGVARNECYRKLVSTISMQDVMSGVLAGEGVKTMNGLRSGSSAIVSAYQRTYGQMRGRLQSRASAKTIANQLAGDYLNLKLNVIPLVSDLDGTLQAAADTSVGRVQSKSVSARYADRSGVTSRSATISPTTNNVDGFNGSHRETCIANLIVKMGGTINVSAANQVPPWQDVWGLSPRDLVPTIYELLPYSWLVDYFTTLGSFVDALALKRGVLTNGWKVEITDVKSVYTFRPQKFYDGSVRFITSAREGREVRQTFTFKRDPFNVDGFIPAMEIKVPSLSQASNIVALAASRLTHPSRLGRISPEIMSRMRTVLAEQNVR